MKLPEINERTIPAASEYTNIAHAATPLIAKIPGFDTRLKIFPGVAVENPEMFTARQIHMVREANTLKTTPCKIPANKDASIPDRPETHLPARVAPTTPARAEHTNAETRNGLKVNGSSKANTAGSAAKTSPHTTPKTMRPRFLAMKSIRPKI